MPTHNAKGAGGISIVSRSRRGAEMGTIGGRRKWRGKEGDVPLWPAENRHVETSVRRACKPEKESLQVAAHRA
jgi:hypothetical protein